MAKFLFVAPPFTGHVSPMSSVGVELRHRGHEVEWLAHEQVRPLLVGESVRWLPADEALDIVDAAMTQRGGLAGQGWLRDLDRVYALAETMLPAVEAVIVSNAPDVVFTDFLTMAGSVAARRAGVPWATSFGAGQPVGGAVRDDLSALKLAGQLQSLRRDYERRWGLDARQSSEDEGALCLAYTIPELVSADPPEIPGLRYVGPVAEPAHQATVSFPWERLDGRPLVYVSLGTLVAHRGRRFFRAALDGLAGLDVQTVMFAPDGVVPEPWGDAIVLPSVPQAALLARATVAIGHGGLNTTWDCLRHGVPMVLAPGFGDQIGMAQRVADLGAGLRVSLPRATASALGASVERLLVEPSFRTEAHRLGAAGLALGGERSAADALEQFASVE